MGKSTKIKKKMPNSKKKWKLFYWAAILFWNLLGNMHKKGKKGTKNVLNFKKYQKM